MKHASFVIELFLYDVKIYIFSYLYQIAQLGDDDDEPRFSSNTPLDEGDTFFFSPRPLKNLVQVDEVDSLSPIMSCQVRFLLIDWSIVFKLYTYSREQIYKHLI